MNERNLSAEIRIYILNLNLFKDPEKRAENDVQNQILSTRLYIVSMAASLCVLVLYTSLSYVTKTITIRQPTVNVFKQLQAQYPQTLLCPCTSISIEYKQFVSFQPTFHQICSSDFVKQSWNDYLNSNLIMYALDFRISGSSFFPTLLSFCNLSFQTINRELLVFNSTKYVTRNVQRLDIFQSQSQEMVSLFKQTTTNAFLQLLSVSRQIMTGNALFSGLSTNYGYATVSDNSSYIQSLNQVFFPWTYTPDDNNSSIFCSCKVAPITCDQSSGIYNLTEVTIVLLFTIPGFRTGCSLVESMLTSTMQCFFDQSCINAINDQIYSTSVSPFNATAMSYNSSNSRYKVTTKIQTIVEQLMIEEWNNQTSFDGYFSQCNPSKCVYTYNRQGDAGYIITIVIALVGGLTTILRIIISSLIAVVRRKKRPANSSASAEGKFLTFYLHMRN